MLAGSAAVLLVAGLVASMAATGVAGAGQDDTYAMDFGQQQVHTTSAARPLVVQNGVFEPALDISSIRTTGDFTETDDCPASVPPGQSCEIRVAFAPRAPGSRGGRLWIDENRPASPVTVALTGVGVTSAPGPQPQPSASPPVSQPAPASSPSAVHVSTLLRTIDLAALSPPSPDPAGITYLPETGRLLISDSEVDEMPSFRGANLYEVDRSGTLARTGTTTPWSFEPSGVSWDPSHATLYVTDDDALKVWMVRAGADGLLGTPDDSLGSFSVASFNAAPDPQGPAYDTATGDLYVVDGAANTVYRIQPGPDGAFGSADDVLTHFAVPAPSGRPGGMTYDPATNTLFVCDHHSKALYQLDPVGTPLATIDISAASLPGGCDVAVAPSSTTPGLSSFWVTTRGIDNNTQPDENDGRLFELSSDVLGQPAPGPGSGPGSGPGPGAGSGQPATPRPPAPTPGGGGYRLVASDGGIFAFGSASFKGSTGDLKLNQPIVAMAPTPSGNGYWFVASDGGIFAFGDAAFKGSTGNLKLAKPIVGMASTPSGNGYWFVASDGGIFAFGDATFSGSTGNIKLTKPIVAMASTPTGKGYWLVASDGGIFAFGDATFSGSTGNLKLAQPIVGMASTPTGHGYWMVASDGGIFAFGDAVFKGSTGNLKLAKPIVAMASTPTGQGYWLVASDGGIFAFGDAAFFGSTGNIKLAKPIVGMGAG